jgi:tetratricopeptide (TPR) repeat protein
LRFERAAHRALPADSNAPAQMASLEMELGEYDAAARDLRTATRIHNTPTVMAVQTRYDELTGHLDAATALLQAAAARTDAVTDNGAQARAWYHFRLGELAFSQGAIDQAKREERYAIAQFPNFELAYRALARFCWAAKDWRCSLEAAGKAADIVPLPESLGYEHDAQVALGDAQAAAQTQSLIFALQRIGNAYRLNDRLLSVYFAQHRVRLADAVRIARREVAVRGNEIYAQDTLAWAAAMDGQWAVADRAMRSAIRFDTQDPRIQFHAGMIDYHFRRFAAARRRLERALKLNAQFDPVYGDQARAVLASLQR